jgi:hypothetical protein
MTQNLTDLYTERDDEDYTPLVHVIKLDQGKHRAGRNKFIEHYVQTYPKRTADQLNDSTTPCPYQQNLSLSHAIIPMICGHEISGTGCLGMLFDYLDLQALLSKDDSGNTVFHRAVQYKYVCDEEYESQKLLLAQLKTLLNRTEIDATTLIRTKNSAGQSPYLYRQATREALQRDGVSGCEDEQDVISEYLKSLCLQSEKLNQGHEVLDLLYGPNGNSKTSPFNRPCTSG